MELKGVNWFGFNDNYQDANAGNKISGMLTAMEGPENATALTTDFKVVAQRMKLLGFNAIRLPFSFKVVALGQKSCKSLIFFIPAAYKPVGTFNSFTEEGVYTSNRTYTQ